jgi:hypothetical protein
MPAKHNGMEIIAPESFATLPSSFIASLGDVYSPAVGHIGSLVSITRRENGVDYGEKRGRVWVKPFPEELMN